ncbi:Rieske 2Fe-2S domain-containing protein [Streptomyces albireticuli]|uniref:cholesterol 7-desaturase n=1 Tax=Streptomyces albireticuli TaxID=1940 RepID=A0A2A2D5H8_9ACTN|nr:Rieske 2Fe-2S domain-containing protein [Streptomyces albireticuli]MCD9195003.1 Rieske (2Fe-2S) protein [Streptomyces albireticuli]PAU46775.1 (2Fe-2S)-binding protein [Streptomyces albireticuli]
MRVRTYKSVHQARPADEAFPAPFPYPAGWFCVGFSREWAPGAVRTRPFMGADVLVYRTRSGTLRVTRPYCPHLGAHLGAGGAVDGELLVCPFHRFAFAVDGSCARTPYGAPPKASLDVLPSREAYGIVWVWHHADGAPPGWELPELPALARPRAFCAVELAGHPQDVMENFVDYGHVTELHGVEHFEVVSEPAGDGPFYTMTFVARRTLPLFPSLLPSVQEVGFRLLGLGGAVILIDVPRYRIRAAQWMLPTPIGPGRIRYWLAANVVTDSALRLPSPVRRSVERASSAGMNRWTLHDTGTDLFVFHHKAYLSHPKLNSGDGPIGAFRNWARQFYASGPAG